MADRLKSSGFILEQQTSEDLLFVEAYGDGGFRLMGRRVEGGVVVLPSGFYPIHAGDVASLSEADFGRILDADEKPEILLLGTGEKMQLIPSAIRDTLDRHGIGHDIMDTGAAARTYNVLLMEQRRVACLLLPVD